jgi:HEAT repeat protein
LIDQIKQAESHKKKELISNIKPEEFIDENLFAAVIECAATTTQDEEVRIASVTTLSQLDQEQVKLMSPKQNEQLRDCLSVCLSDDNVDVKTVALECVEALCISDKKVAGQLVDLLCNETEEDEIREACARILGYLNVPTTNVLNALVKGLSDELVEVKQHSATSLGLLGVGVEQVLNALTKATKDDEYIVRNEASKALKILEKAGSFLMLK